MRDFVAFFTSLRSIFCTFSTKKAGDYSTYHTPLHYPLTHSFTRVYLKKVVGCTLYKKFFLWKWCTWGRQVCTYLPIRTDAYPRTYIRGYPYPLGLFPPAFSTKVLRVSSKSAKSFRKKCQEFSWKVPRVFMKNAKSSYPMAERGETSDWRPRQTAGRELAEA